MKNYIITFLFLFGICGCSPNTGDRGETQSNVDNADVKASLLNQQMVGTWVSTHLNVEINSANGTPENKVLDATLSEFSEILGIRGNSSTFYDDRTFIDVYIGLAEDDRQESSGQWSIQGDSLVMFYLTPTQQIIKYHVNIKGPVGIFTGMVDWDNDKKMDDKLTGRSDKVIRN